MQIQDVVIERQDGPLYCGILYYCHMEDPCYLPWTMDLADPRKVVLKLFPPEESAGFTVVHDHYEEMADAIMERVIPGPEEGAEA